MLSYSSILGTDGVTFGRYIEVREEKFHELIRLVLTNVYVDETWYRETYSDVAEAIVDGKFSSAHEHYLEAGYFEDRLPYLIEVDNAWYLGTNPDVAEAIERGEIASAQEHFQVAGFKEGRLPSPGWSLMSRKS